MPQRSQTGSNRASGLGAVQSPPTPPLSREGPAGPPAGIAASVAAPSGCCKRTRRAQAGPDRLSYGQVRPGPARPGSARSPAGPRSALASRRSGADKEERIGRLTRPPGSDGPTRRSPPPTVVLHAFSAVPAGRFHMAAYCAQP